MVGIPLTSPCLAGVLIQCDESIMAIILKIDAENNHTFVMETLDDETCMISSSKLNELKGRLKDVSTRLKSIQVRSV
jgi:TFIIH basal transcription factor complex TTD-A subunit